MLKNWGLAPISQCQLLTTRQPSCEMDCLTPVFQGPASANSFSVFRQIYTGLMLALLLAARLPAQAVYVPSFGSSSVSGYLMNSATGALTGIAGLPAKTGTSPIQALVHPSGKFLYVLNSASQDISLFAVNSPSGTLAGVACPRCDAPSPSGMAIDPSGQILVVTSDSGIVTPYTINPATGTLVKGPPVSAGSTSKPVNPVIDPSGRYLYIANSNSGQVSGFQIAGGTLTPLTGSPFPAGAGPSAVAASRTAVFVVNLLSGDLWVYQIGPTGALAPNGPPVPITGSPTSVAVDPTGNYVYVANQSQVVALNTTPSPPFALTTLRYYNAGTVPTFLTVDPDGNFVYVVNTLSNDVYGFQISAGGTLIPAGSASTTSAGGLRMLTVRHIGDPTSIVVGSATTLSTVPFGTPVTIKGLMRNNPHPALVPHGSVRFTVNTGAVSNGSASLDPAGNFSFTFDGSTQFLPIGNDVVELTGQPDSGFEAPLSQRLTYTVSKAVPVLTIAPPANPVGSQPVSLSISAPPAGGRLPTGSVAISVDGVVVSNPAFVNGVATGSYTGPPGDHVVTASYAGDSTFSAANPPSATFHSMRITATAVAADNASPVFGQPATFTAVINASGDPIGGTVDFFLDGTKINPAPVPVSKGQAPFGPYIMHAGSHTITAQYSGDANCLPSANTAAPLRLTVNQSPTQVGALQLVGTPVYGPLTFTASVTAPNAVVTGGPVNLNDNGTPVSVANLKNGLITITVPSLAAGSHDLTASFRGDSDFLPAASAPLTLSVGKATPTLAVQLSPSTPLVSGQSVMATATLNCGATATGTIDFFDSGGRITSAGIAVGADPVSFTFSINGAGLHNISAAYSGDANCSAVTSTAVAVHVGQASSVVSTPVADGSAVYGTPARFTVSVAAAAPGSGTPSGAVVFRDGAAVIGSATLAGGTATFTTSSLVGGTHAVTAFYSGSPDYVSSTSAEFDFVVSPATVFTSLQLIRTNTAASVKCIVKSYTIGVPTGLVQISSDTGLLYTLPLLPDASGTASASLPIGQLIGTITATYLGDSNFTPGNPAVLQVDSTPHSPTTLAIKSDPNPATVGQTVAVTVDLAWGSGSLPSGTIQLRDDIIPIATSPAGRQVVFNVVLATGKHNLNATYSGDFIYMSSTGQYTEVVNGPAPTLTLNAGDGVNSFGQAVTVTASVGQPAGNTLAPPQGVVTLMEGANVIGSAQIVNGAASITLQPLDPGIHQILGSYSGDTNWSSANSTILYLKIARIPTSLDITTLTASSGADSIPVTATLLPTPGTGTPTGAVSFIDAASQRTLARASLIGATATAYIPLDAAGGAILAVYEGDVRFEVSRSAPGGFAIVNGASFVPTSIAPGQIAVAFCPDLVSNMFTASGLPLTELLGGIVVSITDSVSNTHSAALYYVSPTQTAFVVPAEVALGSATFRVVNSAGVTLAAAAIRISASSPGLFAATSDGEVVVLYGTGIRNHAADLVATVNSVAVPVLYAGQQGAYPGLDQVNLKLPAGLKTGTAELKVQVDGVSSNSITLKLN
jgi:uncharacterized protein (TIGR03437 family)